jgi:hypothetical protein
METPWIKSKWNASQLDGRTVAFKLHSDMSMLHGKFIVNGNDEGEITVTIIQEVQASPNSWIQHRYIIESPIDSFLQKSSNTNVTEFELICDAIIH